MQRALKHIALWYICCIYAFKLYMRSTPSTHVGWAMNRSPICHLLGLLAGNSWLVEIGAWHARERFRKPQHPPLDAPQTAHQPAPVR